MLVPGQSMFDQLFTFINTSFFDLTQITQNSTLVSLILNPLLSCCCVGFPDLLPIFDLFDEFQWKIFQVLLFIVFINVLLIGLFWKVYGERIIEKFMQPSTSALLIEELKNSISELKLPKEHSPRI